jgi:hypothetical protein
VNDRDRCTDVTSSQSAIDAVISDCGKWADWRVGRLMTEVAHPFKSSVLPAFTITLCGTQHAVKVEMREYALCTHGSTLLFLIAALAVQDLGPGAVLDLNHLMAGSHTPSGRGRFDVLIPSIENNGRIAVARGSVLKQKTRGNGRHQEGSGKRVFGCRGGQWAHRIISSSPTIVVWECRDQTVQCLGPRLNPLAFLSDGSAGSGPLHLIGLDGIFDQCVRGMAWT